MSIRSWLFPRATSTSQAQPFSFPTSQTWDGNDGSWSTFIISVGTPPQIFRILPATRADETWVPTPAGCSQSSDLPNCGNLRGADAFQNAASEGFEENQSSTWVENGTFSLLLQNDLTLDSSATGDFGFDTLGVGNDSHRLSLEHQVVTGVASTAFWLGIFGLSPSPVNLTAPVPSFMQNLADQNLIPSLSFGYTAGAKYRGDSFFGSLTLGGYDSSRHHANNVSFEFDPNISQSLTVGLQSINATQTLMGNVEPLQAGVYSFLDSGVPEIWLPLAACNVFESAFGLTYDNNTDRYLVNDTIHSSLLQLSPVITFTIGPQATGGPSLAFELPYAAFDLQASYPIYPNATNYFPIRRANDTQYTIGRTFLQEAYITVDYTRAKFHVSSAAFPDSSSQELIAILPPANATSTSSPQPTPLSPSGGVGAVGSGSGGSGAHGSSGAHGLAAGIAIGSVATFMLICAFVFYCVRLKGRRRRGEISPPPGNEQHTTGTIEPKFEMPGHEYDELYSEVGSAAADIKRSPAVSRVAEVADCVSPVSLDREIELESLASGRLKELPALPDKSRHELAGSQAAIELEQQRRSIWELPADGVRRRAE